MEMKGGIPIAALEDRYAASNLQFLHPQNSRFAAVSTSAGFLGITVEGAGRLPVRHGLNRLGYGDCRHRGSVLLTLCVYI
jgi:hypothetical protein